MARCFNATVAYTNNPHTSIIAMNNLSIIPAAVLLAAPMCMVAQAEPTTVRDYAMESIDALNELAAILENVTPTTVDESVNALDALKPKLDSLKDADNKFSDEEKKTLAGDEDISGKMMTALTRLMTAAANLEKVAQQATPEQQQQLIKVVEKLQSLMN